MHAAHLIPALPVCVSVISLVSPALLHSFATPNQAEQDKVEIQRISAAGKGRALSQESAGRDQLKWDSRLGVEIQK